MLIDPAVKAFAPHLSLVCISVDGSGVTPDGRLEINNGRWNLWYRDPTKSGGLRGSLFASGNLSFEYTPLILSETARSMPPLPNQWLDSPEVATVIADEPLPTGVQSLSSVFMSLETTSEEEPFWMVERKFHEHEGILVRSIWAVGAIDGQIAVESFERSDRFRIIERRQRERWRGAEWQIVQEP